MEARRRAAARGLHFPGETARDTDFLHQGDLLRSVRRIDRVRFRRDRHRVHANRLPAAFCVFCFAVRAGLLMTAVCVSSIDQLIGFASSSLVVATPSQSIPAHIPYTEIVSLRVHRLSDIAFRTTYRQH